MNRAWSEWGGWIVGLWLGLAGVAAQGQALEKGADPLVTLNEASRGLYQGAKQAALARSGPVIFVEGDVLVLQFRGERTEASFGPDAYHSLKAVAHIPLALDVTLAAAEGGKIDAAKVEELRRYRALVAGAKESVGTREWDKATVDRQREIIAACLELIDMVTASGTCREEDRVAFTRKTAPLVLANAAEATRAILDALDRLVREWRKSKIPADQWDRLTVIVIGRQLPRKDNLAVQYFARLLGEPGEGRRIVYAEGLGEEEKSLDLFATRTVDRGVGKDFFDDPARMYRDLLGDAARAYLPKLFAGR